MNSDIKKLTITNKDLEVLTSGSLLVRIEAETIFNVSYKDEDLKFILSFDNSDPKLGTKNKGEVIDPQTLKVILYNHKNVLGTHISKLWCLGNLSKRPLYWIYRTTFLQPNPDDKDNQGIAEFMYTFYLGPEGV